MIAEPEPQKPPHVLARYMYWQMTIAPTHAERLKPLVVCLMKWEPAVGNKQQKC